EGGALLPLAGRVLRAGAVRDGDAQVDQTRIHAVQRVVDEVQVVELVVRAPVTVLIEGESEVFVLARRARRVRSQRCLLRQGAVPRPGAGYRPPATRGGSRP